MRKLVTLGLLLATLTFAQTDNLDATLLEGLSADENFTTLVSLLEQAGLVEALSGGGPFTVFAPTNNAFEELDVSVLEQLQSDANLLEQVLLTHVVEGTYGINDLQDVEEGDVVSLQGEPLYFDIEMGGLTVNNADIDSANVGNNYANGVVHVVGDVVVPVSLAGQFGVGDFGSDETDAEDAAEGDEETAEGNLLVILENDGRFGMLVGALADAGLDEQLVGDDYTIFAPTDEAFNALSDEDNEALLGGDMVNDILLYHVIPGAVTTDNLVGNEPGNDTSEVGEARDGQATTLQGDNILITLEEDGGFTLNNNYARITEANVPSANGIVHVIDAVLVPGEVGGETSQ